MNRDRGLKRLNVVVALIYAITLGYAFYVNYGVDNEAFYMGFVAILCPLIVPALFRIFHWKPIYEIYIVSTCFCYFASLIGSCLGGYGVPFFDKIVHFCSGLFATLVAVMIFFLIRKSNQIESKEVYHLYLVFINACLLYTSRCV